MLRYHAALLRSAAHHRRQAEALRYGGNTGSMYLDAAKSCLAAARDLRIGGRLPV